MMGETRHAFASSDIEASVQEKDPSLKSFGKKDGGEFDGELSDVSESCLHSGVENGSSFAAVKEKEPHSQREAVIRPQQAGKIDFKSLQNRSRFSSESPWGAIKGSPQSPTGKSRAKEKSRRTGKSDRGHQQLYRLTISSARPNPTIGIAYPQQKVTPPKKVDVGRGGHASGSYRFHVPSIPEREVELQQEDLSFAQGFSEAPSSHISSNYTSQTLTAARPSHGAKIQPPVGAPHENHGGSAQVHYLDFQGNGNGLWPSTEKDLPGANGGLLAPKTCTFPEGGKPSTHCPGPLPFPYPFQSLHSPAADLLQGDSHTQEYVDVSLATGQASHGAFAFHSSSRDWKEEALGNGSCDGGALESRAFGLAAPPLPPFLPSQAQGPLPYYKGRSEHSTEHNGAISPGAIDPSLSTFQENPSVFPASLHISSVPKPIGKRQLSLSKDNVASQRILDPGGSLRRNAPQISPPPQVHFQNKAYGDPSAGGLGPGLVPFEKNLPGPLQAHPRPVQPWEGAKKTYPPMEQSSTMYLSAPSSQLSFGCHSGPEQRQQVKKSWQHLHSPPTMPSQNRIEVSRKLACQKLLLPLGATAEWDGMGKMQKTPADYPPKALQSGEGAVIPRHDLLLLHCSSASAFGFEGAKDSSPPAGCGSRSTKPIFGGNQGVPSPVSSRLPSMPGSLLPPSALAASPSESPLPSPIPNPTSSGSTCSSLSPMSSSPNSHSFEEGIPLSSSAFFHHPCSTKEGNKPFGASEPLNAVHYPAVDSSLKVFQLSPEAPKDELLSKSLPTDGHFPRPNLEGFEAKLPPPPYSSHHLLASSLSSASLDQLDVFLTCKQCDQNFSNLPSFFEHRQFCSSHAALHQPQGKDSSRGAETRKPQPTGSLESLKQAHAGLGLLPPPDPHGPLLALNKAEDFLVDGEGKGDSKDDPLKGHQLSGGAPNALPLSASDLEIDDAKLDSLITEALNGLGYQSDNPEIDSSFIDVFVDEELASVKVTHGAAPCKTKEGLPTGQKTKPVDETMRAVNNYEEHPGGDDAGRSRASGKQCAHKDRGMGWLPTHGEESPGLAHNTLMEPAKYNREQVGGNAQLQIGRKNGSHSPVPPKQASRSMPDRKQPKNVPCVSSPVRGLRPAGTFVATKNVKDTKKQKLRSNTWSKELIHKIVEQKNKLHKLNAKSSKVAPLSLLTDRLLPETKDSKFGEYEYISESDEERVEYAKRYCRRKLGSRFNGRLRSNFGRRRQGRAGREKEKEAIWRYGLKRDRGEEPKRTPAKEPGRRDPGLGRVRRRGSRSSTSSYQTTGLSSETSNSPQSPGKVDSDTEKESDMPKRCLQNAKLSGPLPGGILAFPEKDMVGNSHRSSSDLSRASESVDSGRLQLAGFRTHQRDIPTVAPVSYMDGGEGGGGLLQSQVKQRCSKAAIGKGSAMLFTPEDVEQHLRSTSHDNAEPRTLPKDRKQAARGGNPHCLQFTAYKGETLKYHVGEFLSPSPVGTHSIPQDESTSYEQVDVRSFKKQKELIAPIGCFGDNSHGGGTAGKEGLKMLVDAAAETFSACKALPDSFESSSLFSKPSAAQPSQNNHAYFCQGDLDISPFKRKQHEILPYEADREEQGKVSSPLGFDSSSVFAELPVAEFDATLYDDMASGKEGYVPFECASDHPGKMASFDPQYSSFLHEKDWNLMEEVPPVLPEEISQLHGLPVEKPLAKRYPAELSQMPFPERIADFSMPFMSGLSDEELEIKRLVTELESQLQTNKLTMEEASGEHHQTPEPHASTERNEASHQFLPLILDQETEEKGLFLMEEGFESASLLQAKTSSCENSGHGKTLLPLSDGKFGSHTDPWSRSVPFSPFPPSAHTPSAPGLISVGPLGSKGEQNKIHENVEGDEISGKGGFRDAASHTMPDSCLPGISIEIPHYASHLMQNPDALFPKNLEEPAFRLHGTLPPRAGVFPELPPKEEMFSGPAEVPCLKSESGLEDTGTPETEGVQSIKGPEERSPSFPRASSPETLESKATFQSGQEDLEHPEKAEQDSNPTLCPSPATHSNASSGGALCFEALSCSKEVNGEMEYGPAPQEKSDNPLQQLQLFVARTVKNNEEDLLTPCFPTLPSASTANVPLRQKEESQDSLQSEEVVCRSLLEKRTEPRIEGLEKAAEELDAPGLILEPSKKEEDLSQRGTYVNEPTAPQSPGSHFSVAEREQQKLQLLKDEHSEEGDMNTCADGISLEPSKLSPLSNQVVISLLKDEGAQGGRVTGEVEGDQEKTTLAFSNGRISPLSPGSFVKETPGCALTTMPTGHHPSWDEVCRRAQGPNLVNASQVERCGECPAERQQCSLSLGPTSPAENHLEESCLLRGTDLCPGSGPVLAKGCGLKEQASPCENTCLHSFSPAVGLVDQEDLQRNNTGKVAHSDSGAPPSEDVHHQKAAGDQHIPLSSCRYSSGAKKTVDGNSMEGPSEDREQKGVPPFISPTKFQPLQQSHAENSDWALVGPQTFTPVQPALSLSSTDLGGTERAVNLQMSNYKPPTVLPFEKKDLSCSEDVPKHPDGEESDTCSLRSGTTHSPSASLQDILLGQPQSEVDPPLPMDSRTKGNGKCQERKEDKTYSKEGKADQTQKAIRDVDIQEMPRISVMEIADIDGVHLSAGQVWGPSESVSHNALQGIDKGGNHSDNKDCELTENAEGSSGSVKQETGKEGSPGNISRAEPEKTKKRKGSQVTCDICSISFRSKTGLMRHKAMKHLNKKESALQPGLAPLEKELKMTKQLSKKTRKSHLKQKASSSHISEAAVGQPFPKSYRRQRRESSQEFQEVVYKVLGELNVTLLASACELQNTDNPSKEIKTRPLSSQEEREDDQAPGSKKETNTGKKEKEANADELDSCSGKKLKGKTRKAKEKVVTKQNALTRCSQRYTDSPALCSGGVPSTMKLLFSSTSKSLESSSSSTEEQASRPSMPLPCPAVVKEAEGVDERTSSAKETAGQKPLHNAEGPKELEQDPESERKLDTEESGPSGSTKQTAEESSSSDDKQDDGKSLKEPERKETLLEEMRYHNQNSPSGCVPKLLPQPCPAGATEKDSPKVMSEDTLDAGVPCSLDSQSWRREEFPLKNEDGNGVRPDIFDDDSTFSQLFPRNDQFARRKCTRVYGKRTKKPKPVVEVNTRPAAMPDLFSIRMASDLGETNSFCVTREDLCEYDTISIDDTLLLNMCHGSKAMPNDATSESSRITSLQPEAELREEVADLKNGGTLSIPAGDLPTSGSWDGLKKDGDNIPADEALLNPSMELINGHLTVGASPEPPDLEEESYDAGTNENPCSPALHTIDMEILNSKFEMGDVCFYRVGEDHLGCTDNECTLGFKPASIFKGRAVKNKAEEVKQGKSRSDLNLKTKDKQYKCKVCFQWFLTLGELDFHKLSHNPSPPPTCYMCVQRKFSSREQLRDHLKEKHARNKAGLWACGMCLKEISDVWMYNEHLREHATQFARKGQAQKSVLGLPACFGEDDAAVTQFLNSIMCRKPSKVSRHAESGSRSPACKESKGLKDPPGQEADIHKDSPETQCKVKPPVASLKGPAVPSPESAPKVEGTPKLVPMHPECKDPSRDCHHCGKQFPKPFKLQRHLVVHSLQKIYLCHRCPMFYQETKELRSHLSQEHGTAEENIKHTTLYACELCADVMHVIKKSFICSTCNYTFSKKEQYDRHMEKHLVGSSRTFRFRGVLRPGLPAKEGDKKGKKEAPPKEEAPAVKKKKAGHHNSWLGSPVSPHRTAAPQAEGEPLLPLGSLDSHLPSATPLLGTATKTQGLGGVFSNVLPKTKTCPLDSLPPVPSPVPRGEAGSPEDVEPVCSLSAGQPSKGDAMAENLCPSFDTSDAVRLDLTSLGNKRTAAATAQKLTPAHLAEKPSNEPDLAGKVTCSGKTDHMAGTWESQQAGDPPAGKKATEFSPASAEASEYKRDPKMRCHVSLNPSETHPHESVVKLPEATFPVLPLKDKASSPIQNRPAREIPSKRATSSQALAENPAGTPCPPDEAGEIQKPPFSKDKALANTAAASSKDNCGVKEAGDSPVKAPGSHLRIEAGSTQARPSHPDLSKSQERLATAAPAKMHPKKRKEHKAPHKASTASRENMEGDGSKKKKARTQDPARSEGSDGGGRRTDWPNSEGLALSCRRGDALCNKMTPKLKASMAGSHLKKMVLDQCFQKKAEFRHANGELKRKKDVLGSKVFHPLLAKDPSTSLPGSLNRHRAVRGAKLPNSHNYRTAESQNNLLSQLFGQKLTSFKIPLRRDTSE